MVNTFLTHSSFHKIAQTLDTQRLGKQRVEAKQIIDVLEGRTQAWVKHPIVIAWRGYTDCLKRYANIMIDEFENRGCLNTMKKYTIPKRIKYPWWIKYKPLQYSHRASLLRKDKGYYSTKFSVPEEYKDQGYIWISKLTPEQIEKIKRDPFCYSPKDICAVVTTAPRCQGKIQTGPRAKSQCTNAVCSRRSLYCRRHLPKYEE